MVPALSGWHERHADALAELATRRDRGETLVAAGHALIETYSVLTRLPAPYRLSPAAAISLMEANFLQAEVIALDAAGYRGLLTRAATGDVAGGQIYDAVIAECALAASVNAVLTFNPRHFEPLSGGKFEVVVPGGSARGAG